MAWGGCTPAFGFAELQGKHVWQRLLQCRGGKSNAFSFAKLPGKFPIASPDSRVAPTLVSATLVSPLPGHDPSGHEPILCGSAMLYSLFTIFLVLSPTAAFSRRLPAAAGASRAAVRMAEDPLANPFIMAINKLQEAIQESPASKFKKGVAKLQAGNYDKIAIQAELNSLMAEPAIMFSFTT